jgi:hypothetical protein
MSMSQSIMMKSDPDAMSRGSASLDARTATEQLSADQAWAVTTVSAMAKESTVTMVQTISADVQKILWKQPTAHKAHAMSTNAIRRKKSSVI